MFENITALSKIAKELQSLDSEAKALVDDYTTLLPKVRDNLMSLAFQRDNLAGISSAIEALRSDIEPIISESPKEPVSPEPEVIEHEDDDESGIIIERIDKEEPDLVVEDSPIPDFEETEEEPQPLDRVEDWDELFNAKVEELISSGADKEARSLKKQCLEIRKTMYDESGDIINMPTEESGMSKGAKSVWLAARKEVVRMNTEKTIANQTPEQTAVIEEMLDDTEFTNPSEEPKKDDVEELLSEIDSTQNSDQEIDEDLDALLASIDE